MSAPEAPFGKKITDVEVVRDFVVRLTFNDGVVGKVDLESIVSRGPVFEPHRSDPEFFRSVYVDKVSRTITWPNETDLDPDVLYAKATGVYDDLVAPGGPWAE